MCIWQSFLSSTAAGAPSHLPFTGHVTIPSLLGSLPDATLGVCGCSAGFAENVGISLYFIVLLFLLFGMDSRTRSEKIQWKLVLLTFKNISLLLFFFFFSTFVADRFLGVFLLSFISFTWRIIALQCHVSFCCRAKWISYMYTWITSLLSLSPASPPPQPSKSSQSTKLSSWCYTPASHWLSVLYMTVCVCQCYYPNSSCLFFNTDNFA